MSEEILKALMQLFAIITKQDEGVSVSEKEYVRYFLKTQLREEQVNHYFDLFDRHYEQTDTESGDKPVKKEKKKVDLEELQNHPVLKMDLSEMTEEDKARKARVEKKIRKELAKRKEIERSGGTAKEESRATSVFESVKTLAICQQINATLSQSQKIIVLVRLMELLKTDNKFTPQRMSIMDTISKVFNFGSEEYQSIYGFVLNDMIFDYDNSNLLVVDADEAVEGNHKYIPMDNLQGTILILKVDSVGLYFMRYIGKEELSFNGLLVDKKRIYLFAPGSTIRLPKDKPIYYSEIVAKFLTGEDSQKLQVEAKDVTFVFPNDHVGLSNVNLSESQGKLVGIMGASGAGKSTLLNVLCGLEKPTSGEVLINGINIHEEPEKVEGVIGYIPQDDLLMEELTVYQNLYYNVKLCFASKSEEELDAMVIDTLNNLGLYVAKDLKVGNPLMKTISGGQRKRLNIGLELIRESSVLFVDEPTSGLSSRDSENVMDLLRELSMKGKVIYVVIHQPSSDIYKMFDRIFILDKGGLPIYYGNPVEAVTYFKQCDHQINADEGECDKCGNVDVELIFNIIEAQVVDEYGQFTGFRKMTPEKWNKSYEENFKVEHKEEEKEAPRSSLDLPNFFKQWKIFSTRDVLSKLSNKQYMTINLLEAPLLAFIMAFTIRYVDESEGTYMYSTNENIPAYLFICIIIALFMGLTVSAEEIVKDQRILKREAFLNLSKGSYILSKIGILFTISAIQTLSFVIIGNWVLGVDDLFWSTWLVLFTVSCFANMLGLNVSASFNRAITIYILIPILLIPQMIFSGAMFNFDKLNEWIGDEAKVPIMADVMVSRWAFEALAVNQFMSNKFEKTFYPLEKVESIADFKKVYFIPAMRERVTYCQQYLGVADDNDIKMVKEIVSDLQQSIKDAGFIYDDIERLSYNNITRLDLVKLDKFLDEKGKSVNVSGIRDAMDKVKQLVLFELPERRAKVTQYVNLLRKEIKKQNIQLKSYQYEGDVESINMDEIHQLKLMEIEAYLIGLNEEYTYIYNMAANQLDELKFKLRNTPELKAAYKEKKSKYYNYELANLVKKKAETKKISEKNEELVQIVDPIYRNPMIKGPFDYRSHFFAPKKPFMGKLYGTYSFNVLYIWVFSFFLWITLYFGVLRWFIESIENAIENIGESIIQPFLSALYNKNEKTS